MKETYWVSSPKMTIFVEVDEEGIISDTSPITGKFVNQTMRNLIHWLKKFGKVEIQIIN